MLSKVLDVLMHHSCHRERPDTELQVESSVAKYEACVVGAGMSELGPSTRGAVMPLREAAPQPAQHEPYSIQPYSIQEKEKARHIRMSEHVC